MAQAASSLDMSASSSSGCSALTSHNCHESPFSMDSPPGSFPLFGNRHALLLPDASAPPHHKPPGRESNVTGVVAASAR